MKNKSILAIALVGVMTTACNKKQGVNPTSQLSSSNEITVDNIGQKHNESLDYVYSKLSANLANQNKQLTGESLVSQIRAYSAEYLVSQNLGKDKAEIFNSYNKINYTVAYGEYLGTITSTKRDEIRNQVTEKLSIATQIQISNIYTSIDLATSSTDLSSKISNVLKASKTSLSTDEYNKVVAAGNVAMSSYSYWIASDNFSKWKIFTNKKNGKTAITDPIVKAVVKADCEGFIGGCTGGLVLGPLGWLAGGLIGAPLASAWEGLWSI